MEWRNRREEKRREWGGEGMERIVGSATTVQVSLVSWQRFEKIQR